MYIKQSSSYTFRWNVIISCHVNHPPVVDLTNAVCISFYFKKSKSFMFTKPHPYDFFFFSGTHHNVLIVPNASWSY